jgi:hypothetical protein
VRYPFRNAAKEGEYRFHLEPYAPRAVFELRFLEKPPRAVQNNFLAACVVRGRQRNNGG